jgi:hypothetical protein
MFSYIADDINPSEIEIRFSFRCDLLDALKHSKPLLPICTIYSDRFPLLQDAFERDFSYEFETGFRTDEELEAELKELKQEEEKRRISLVRTKKGRLRLLAEDLEFESVMRRVMTNLKQNYPPG